MADFQTDPELIRTETSQQGTEELNFSEHRDQYLITEAANLTDGPMEIGEILPAILDAFEGESPVIGVIGGDGEYFLKTRYDQELTLEQIDTIEDALTPLFGTEVSVEKATGFLGTEFGIPPYRDYDIKY